MACIDFTSKYIDQDIGELKNLHTKQLLKIRNNLYYISEYCSDMCSAHDPECQSCSANRKYNRDEILKILNEREHVPNKQESKSLRKERIKKGK